MAEGGVLHVDYRDPHVRRQTFTTWPLSAPNIHDMAEAGFVYKGDNIHKLRATLSALICEKKTEVLFSA